MVPVKNCTGCTACVQRCPVQCIGMKADAEGFLYPSLLEGRSCINCGLCEKLCPLSGGEQGPIPKKAFGCHLKDTDSLLKSTSGGAFYAMGRKVIENQGVVYGASLMEDLSVHHQRADNLSKLDALRKSKYIQSRLDNTFSEVRADLQEGIYVLFSGTPCQVAGLMAFLDREYENLLTVQVFCSETLSPFAWGCYIRDWEKKNGKKAVYFEYKTKLSNRDRSENRYDPWRNPQILLKTATGENLIINRAKDPFINAWAHHMISRPSCNDCQFKFKDVSKYPADLSIGDFWGCENNAPELFCALGTSAVIAHTSKGEAFFKGLNALLDISEVDVNAVLKGNPNIRTSVIMHPARTNFFNALRSGADFEILVRKYLGYDEAVSSLTRKIGLLGSYNTRTALADICANSACQLLFQYSNSSLISAAAPMVQMPDKISLPANPFRAQMLEADFNKQLFALLSSDHGMLIPDCLVIDFVEERFPLCSLGDSLITLSDAAVDTGYTFSPEDFDEEEIIRLWQKSCLKLIDIVKANKHIKTVILVKAYLNKEYREHGSRLPFPNADWINVINRRLEEYYRFFQENMPSAIVVGIEDDAVLFCDKSHKHGCYPWHANQEYYQKLSRRIAEKLTETANA